MNSGIKMSNIDQSKTYKVFIGSLPVDTNREEILSYVINFLGLDMDERKALRLHIQKEQGYSVLKVPNQNHFEKLVANTHFYKGKRLQVREYLTHSQAKKRLREKKLKLQEKFGQDFNEKKVERKTTNLSLSSIGTIESERSINSNLNHHKTGVLSGLFKQKDNQNIRLNLITKVSRQLSEETPNTKEQHTSGYRLNLLDFSAIHLFLGNRQKNQGQKQSSQ